MNYAPFLSNHYVSSLYSNGRKPLGEALAAYPNRLRALFTASRHDIVWIEKEVMAWLPAWAEAWLAHKKIPFLVDYDDATFHTYDQNAVGLVRRLLGHKIDDVMRMANVVTAGNEYLAQRARAAGARRVEIIPTVIDLDRYRPAPPENDGIFRIGWIGTPVTAKFLQEVAGPLAAICGDGKTRLVAIGPKSVDLPGVNVETRPWSEETEVAEMMRCDAAIMPLPDAPFERGKCGYKLIQFMACGRPVVGSPVGVNSSIVEHGKAGYLAASPEEWMHALCALRDDPVRRREMGAYAREKVERHYCLQVSAPILAELMEGLLFNKVE